MLNIDEEQSNGVLLKQHQKERLECLLNMFVIEADVLHSRRNIERPVFNNYESISNGGNLRKRERPSTYSSLGQSGTLPLAHNALLYNI